MKRDEAKVRVVSAAEEMFEEMWEWGAEHPRATFDEIAGKAALLRRGMTGVMLEQLVQQHGDGRYEEAVCPGCGEPMKSSGRRTRRVIHAEGDVKVKRSYRHCPDCGQGLFPPGSTTSSDGT